MLSKNHPKINWLSWGKEPFEKAKRENKPILLDLTAIWCHWCHVMDLTSYSDAGIIKTINEDFVPVKVYIDERPDIKDRYNMGGFPSTVFLDQEGNIIGGDTYVPPERLKLVLELVKNSYRNSKLGKTVHSKKEAGQLMHINSNSSLSPQIINSVLLAIEENFDSNYGGFGFEPKFPPSEVLDLLLMQRDKKYVDMALKTLDAMHEGIYDTADYGFFRYSVTQDWKTPHYEKMLDTNAGLLRNYAAAFIITKNKRYCEVTKGILGYVGKFLSNGKNGGFYGSQDANEEFYQLEPQERKNKEQPYVDKTIYVDWNAMMVSSYLKAADALSDDKPVSFAILSANFILKNCHKKDSGLCHFFGEKPMVYGLLCDNIYFLNCLIDLYSKTKNQDYLASINCIAEFILKNFYDSGFGGFFDRMPMADDMGMLIHREKQFLENCFSSIVFLKVYRVNNDGQYKGAARQTLLYFAGTYKRFGHFAALYATAVDMMLGESTKSENPSTN